MNSPNVLVTVAGLAGADKRVVADAIAAEAPFAPVSDEPGAETYLFDGMSRLSAGNYYRAAAHLAITRETAHEPITRFTDRHKMDIWSILADPDSLEFLYSNEAIEQKVSDLSSRIPGMQALCDHLFVNEVTHAYQQRFGRNLIIADALDPVGQLQRANRLGDEPDQISPGSLLPIFVDTPPIAVGHLSPGPTFWVADKTRHRRQLDARRTDSPARPPAQDESIPDIADWEMQFSPEVPRPDTVLPLRLKYDADTGPSTLSQFAGKIVEIAQIVSSRSALIDHR